MKQVLFWCAVLIGLFLVLVYYKGFSSDANATGGALGTLILFLQGRDSSGNIANYPTQN